MKLDNEIRIFVEGANLVGNLTVPDVAQGVVLFVHGSGSSRHSPRNQFVAKVLNDAGLATLLFDLLTPDEEAVDNHTREHRFNLALLAHRLLATTRWTQSQAATGGLPIGYFGSSTGGGAALLAASEVPEEVFAVVSRGGRPDLAGPALARIAAPTLLIVGGEDDVVIDLNREAMAQMCCEVKLELLPGATHLFEEAGALELVARLASNWFTAHLGIAHPVS